MVYVMADIHGETDRFEDIMNQIQLTEKDTLYILGDVIDRSPNGIKILLQIMRTPNIKMLLGNHEDMMMNALYHPIEIKNKWVNEEWIRANLIEAWYENGGQATHNYLKRIRKDLRQKIFEYLETLPVNVEIKVNGQEFILTHAALIENYKVVNYRYKNEKEFAIWDRHAHKEYVPDGKIIVFGHTPTSRHQSDKPYKIWKYKDRIGIDCGCGYSQDGRLGCLRLDDMKEYYSQK